MRDDRAGSVNLELKPSDSSANPYLSLGAVIHAGLDGIRRKLDPGEAVNVDPATLTDAQRLAVGARGPPTSLADALDALDADDLPMESLGDLRRRFGLEISDLVFAARLRREPELRRAVDGWFAGADDLGWVEWEQRKHERLLAA